MRTNDLRRALKKSYEKCETIRPGYEYGNNALVELNSNTATDGVEDITLALYIAWRQWGDYMGINDACGNPISYKKEMLEIIEGMVEIHDVFKNPNDLRRVSGSVGFDGYLKNGDIYCEATDWAYTGPPYNKQIGSYCFRKPIYFDYLAPAYFRTFHELLESKGQTGWNVNQYKRVEASSDWLIGEWVYQDPKNLPIGGMVDIENYTPVVQKNHVAHDNRASWRTILNYVWHGNPDNTWNPVTHQVDNVGNTYQYDAAKRLTQFANNASGDPWGNSCENLNTNIPFLFNGVSTLNWNISPNGADA
jgi:hypothetical protein